MSPQDLAPLSDKLEYSLKTLSGTSHINEPGQGGIKPATLILWAPSPPHTAFRKSQHSPPAGAGLVLLEHMSFDRPVPLKRR